ncbi:hypothetical protein AGR7B_Lc40231 [Agrobacterium deltaense RV3]|nr:hypothetical protein AGR7B_Lc40231 [Agrobacterium deltaense RV3]
MTRAQSCLTTIRKLSQVLEAVKRMPAESVLDEVPKYVSRVEISDRAHPAFVFFGGKGPALRNRKSLYSPPCGMRRYLSLAMIPMRCVPSGGGKYG